MSATLALFAALPRDQVAADERIDLLVLIERCESWLNAVKQQVFADVRRDAGLPNPSSDGAGQFEDTVLEAGLALRWSEWMVNDRLATGAEIIDRLPDTWLALAEGRINFWQAHKLAEATRKLDDVGAVARLEQHVLAKATTLTRAETGRLVDRELVKADPAAAEQRRQSARDGRTVARSRDEDGMANLHVHGPAEDIAAIDAALDLGAQQLKAAGLVEDIDQGRFDTSLSWATDYLARQDLPATSARPAAVGLVVKESTVDGLDDDPGELDRWGPVTAQVARDLVNGAPPGDCTVQVLRIDDDTGWLLPPPGVRVDFGRAKRFFTGAARQFVLERFRVCEFPGCAMPMRLLDADHWKQHARGGATDATTNAGPACPHHNRTTRNRGGWTIEPNGDGTATLTTPQGRRYPITPHNYLD
jgi:hypothetical protein